MKINDYLKNYLNSSSQKDHSILVKNLSLEIFNQIKNFFDIKMYDNPNDIKLLGYGALLHDIGVNLEKNMNKPHNKIARDLILKNGVDNLNEREILIVANIVRYHRKKAPDTKHKYFNILTDDEKRKTTVFSSIVRLADALDSEHFSIINNVNAEFDTITRILTLKTGINIMLNIELKDVLDKKKIMFEKTFNVKVSIK